MTSSESSSRQEKRSRIASQMRLPNNALLAIKAADPSRLGLPDSNERAFWVGLVVVVLSLISALATYLILTGLTPISPRNEVVVAVLFVNVVLILAMIGRARLAGDRPVAGLARQGGRRPPARPHRHPVQPDRRAADASCWRWPPPTTFSRALDSWFSQRTRQIVENSLDVASAYLEEHGQVIRTDIVNMVADLDDAAGHAAQQAEGVPRPGVRAGRAARPAVAYVHRCRGQDPSSMRSPTTAALRASHPRRSSRRPRPGRCRCCCPASSSRASPRSPS